MTSMLGAGARPLGSIAGVPRRLLEVFTPTTPVGLLVALGEGRVTGASGLERRVVRSLLETLRRDSPALAGSLERVVVGRPQALGCLGPRVVLGNSAGRIPVRLESRGLPRAVSLLEDTAPGRIRSQGDRGTCVAFATLNAYEARIRRKAARASLLSPQFLYHCCKAIDRQEGEGTFIETAVEVLGSLGVCTEETFPYDGSVQREGPGGPPPPRGAYEEALGFVCPEALALDCADIGTIKAALADGYVVVAGVPVYESWIQAYTHLTGFVPDRLGPDDQLIGYHAIAMMSYDDATERFGFKNSWTRIVDGKPEGWAVDSPIAPGYGTLSYRYVGSSGIAVAALEAPASRWNVWANGVDVARLVASPTIARVLVPVVATCLIAAAGKVHKPERHAVTEPVTGSSIMVKIPEADDVRESLGDGTLTEIRHVMEVYKALDALPEGEARRLVMLKLEADVRNRLLPQLEAARVRGSRDRGRPARKSKEEQDGREGAARWR